MKLGVNIDHIATLRNARGQNNPNLLRALKVCHDAKVDTLTVHLREDRRHIKDQDLLELKKNSKIPINLEMALTDEMIQIANKINPDFICLVPEKRDEMLLKSNGKRTVPQIFVNDHHVGCLLYTSDAADE